jgi:dephospho-CoA kinase
MIIGVAGKYCAGKDSVVEILKSLGFKEINMDKIGHEALEEKKEEIARAFGLDMLTAEGAVSRRVLGRIAFSNKKELNKLERIVHPLMAERVKQIISNRKDNNGQRNFGQGNFVINCAILFKMGLDRLCDMVFCIKAPFFIRLKRALKRDKLSFIETVRRLSSQDKICPKLRNPDVDIYRISNLRTKRKLKKKINKVIRDRYLITGGTNGK